MKKILIYTFCSILLLFQSACKQTLNALPENAKVDENTILDQRTAEVALRGAYYLLYNIPGRGTNITSWDNHQWQPAYYAGYLAGAPDGPDEENRYAEGYTIASIWNESYATINAANGIIGRIDMLPDAAFTSGRKNAISAEARFIRAYSHFRILSYYAEWFNYDSNYGILIRNELSNLDNIAKARSNVKQSYDFILGDIDFAIANAPAQNPNYYASKWSAIALKIRVLMSRAQSGDYAEVIKLADELIQNSPYRLEANARDIFRSKGLASTEVILGIKPQVNQENSAFNISYAYSNYTGQITVSHYATKKLYDFFSPDDPRRNWVTGALIPGTDRPGGRFFSKYIELNARATIASETSYAFRLSEVYLLKAEAIAQLGSGMDEARQILKLMLQHAGATELAFVDQISSYQELQMQVFYEISRNLVAEDGQDWMALLRLPFETVKVLKPTIRTRAQYILPIPAQEFMTNPTIGEQNPGYSKN